MEQFNLEKKVQVQLAIEPPMSGEIHLNTIQPSSYPWSGTYFDGVPIELQPKPKTGFVFSHWLPASNIPDTLSDSLVVNVSQQTQTFTAVFKAAPLAPDGPDIHFSVQPNPSNGLFSIISDNKTIAKTCDFEVYDLQGRRILKGQVSQSNETTIDLTAQQAGIYWISIYKGEERLENLSILKY